MTVPATLDTVAVVGNGRVGHGMAQIFAAAGHRVVMIGRREESLAAGDGQDCEKPRRLRSARGSSLPAK